MHLWYIKRVGHCIQMKDFNKFLSAERDVKLTHSITNMTVFYLSLAETPCPYEITVMWPSNNNVDNNIIFIQLDDRN